MGMASALYTLARRREGRQELGENRRRWDLEHGLQARGTSLNEQIAGQNEAERVRAQGRFDRQQGFEEERFPQELGVRQEANRLTEQGISSQERIATEDARAREAQYKLMLSGQGGGGTSEAQALLVMRAMLEETVQGMIAGGRMPVDRAIEAAIGVFTDEALKNSMRESLRTIFGASSPENSAGIPENSGAGPGILEKAGMASRAAGQGMGEAGARVGGGIMTALNALRGRSPAANAGGFSDRARGFMGPSVTQPTPVPSNSVGASPPMTGLGAGVRSMINAEGSTPGSITLPATGSKWGMIARDWMRGRRR